MAGELFGQLEARGLGGDDSMHHSRLLEHHEVSVHGALHEPVANLEDLGEREWPGCIRQDLDDRGPLGCEALLHAPQPRGHFVAQFGCHGAECTVALDGSH